MNKNMFLTLILLVLVVVAVAQAVQLTSLKTKLEGNSFAVSTKAAAPASSSGQVNAPKSLDNLPKMVGGC